jgi:hypothetical protein
LKGRQGKGREVRGTEVTEKKQQFQEPVSLNDGRSLYLDTQRIRGRNLIYYRANEDGIYVDVGPIEKAILDYLDNRARTTKPTSPWTPDQYAYMREIFLALGGQYGAKPITEALNRLVNKKLVRVYPKLRREMIRKHGWARYGSLLANKVTAEQIISGLSKELENMGSPP